MTETLISADTSLPAGLRADHPAGEADIFSKLLAKEINPQTPEAGTELEAALHDFARSALNPASKRANNIFDTIKGMIADIDAKLSAQVNEILHDPEFQKVERTWRGLHYLVHNTQSGPNLKIKYLNISKEELGRTLSKHTGKAYMEGVLFKKVYQENLGQLGGHPIGCLIGDYHFDHKPGDVAMLRDIASVAASAHAPFIAAAAPSVLQLSSFRDIGNASSIANIFGTAEYTAWRSMRSEENTRYLALTMPRFLVRQPYGPDGKPSQGFAFEEKFTNDDHESFCWANAAYAMGANITRSFHVYGWVSQIRGQESGGVVARLPTYTFRTDDGAVDLKCPTEVAISDGREGELAACGFMPLLHRKNTDEALFIGAQSLQSPAKYNDPAATANANLAARLPYMFAVSRFAHYLKAIVRDRIGSFTSRDDMHRFLSDWIKQFVDGDPVNSTVAKKAECPLAAASVQVEDAPGNPGFYNAVFHLQPHYQLEGLSVALKLVSKFPAVNSK